MKAIDRVFKHLTESGLKPSKVEKDLGLSNGYLATMQKRNADIGETNLIKLAEYLNFSLSYLVTGVEDNTKATATDIGNLKQEIIELQRDVISLQRENAKLKEYKSIQPVHHRADADELTEPVPSRHEMSRKKQKNI